MPRILLVDSDPDIAPAVKRYLVWFGLDVDLAVDCQDAMPKLKSVKYDLIVLSVFSTFREGCAHLKEIRALPGLKNQRVALTGPEEPEFKDYTLLKKSDAHFINKYGPPSGWYEKIDMILRI